jgi:hypothetical protein
MATQSQTSKASGAKKPYIRIMTDKRREQNRRAQKVYRERLKKKLEELNEQQQHDDPEETLAADDEGLPTNVVPGSASNLPNSENSRARVFDLADAFTAAGDLPLQGGGGMFPALQFQIGAEPLSPESSEGTFVHTNDEDYGDMDMRLIWETPVTERQPTPPMSSDSTSLTLFSPQRPLSTSSAGLADPYMNVMRLVGESNLEASIAVGLSIRISRSSYVNDHPSWFPTCYVAQTQCIGVPPERLVKVPYKFTQGTMHLPIALKEEIDSIRQPLRPTPAQLLHAHPTYLDCIVFPHFREQAVIASHRGQLDHGALFMDLMGGGLVCWGGMSGKSNRHGKAGRNGSRDSRDSVAWSSRSWEAKRWFLKKWTWLIGTEEDEEARADTDGIWRGSRWWQDMRGEDDSDDEESFTSRMGCMDTVVEGADSM